MKLLRMLPDSALASVLPSRLGFVSAESVALPPLAVSPVRLLIAPVNFAGQAWHWARAVEREVPGVTAVAMAYTAGSNFRFPIDQAVPASVFLASRRWQQQQRLTVAASVTHVLVEAGRHLFGNVYNETVADQIRALQSAGVKVAMLTHGSDMRIPELHASTHRFSHYAPGEWDMTETMRAEASRNRALLDQVQTPIFASTPGMLIDVPEAVWLPVVVETALWKAGDVPFDASVPLVVHAPSNPAIKGTALVEPVLERLVDESLIRYRRLEGIPSADMPSHMREADIVLDQFRLGDYGVAACEALAAGRVVVGNIDDFVRDYVLAETGMKIPIVQADPETLERVLRELVADRPRARAIGAQGPPFVDAIHNGHLSSRALGPFLGVDVP